MKRVFSAEDIHKEPVRPIEDELNIERVKDELRQDKVKDILIKKNKVMMARNIPSYLKTYVHALKL